MKNICLISFCLLTAASKAVPDPPDDEKQLFDGTIQSAFRLQRVRRQRQRRQRDRSSSQSSNHHNHSNRRRREEEDEGRDNDNGDSSISDQARRPPEDEGGQEADVVDLLSSDDDEVNNIFSPSHNTMSSFDATMLNMTPAAASTTAANIDQNTASNAAATATSTTTSSDPIRVVSPDGEGTSTSTTALSPVSNNNGSRRPNISAILALINGYGIYNADDNLDVLVCILYY